MRMLCRRVTRRYPHDRGSAPVEFVLVGALLTLADGGRSLLGRRKLPPRTPILLASIKALAQQRAEDPRAVSILAAAARSSDPELRQAAQGAAA